MNHFDAVIFGADEIRKVSSPVPGVGPIARVRVANDVVYASRSYGTAMVEWQATEAGWTEVEPVPQAA